MKSIVTITFCLIGGRTITFWVKYGAKSTFRYQKRYILRILYRYFRQKVIISIENTQKVIERNPSNYNFLHIWRCNYNFLGEIYRKKSTLED